MSSAVDVSTHVRVCMIDDLEVERGRAALIDGQQVALFLLPDGTVLGVDNLDPYSGAHVISRGIVGSRGDAPTVASPLHKQIFDLRSGECVESHGKQPAALRVWPVAIDDGCVYVGRPESTGP